MIVKNKNITDKIKPVPFQHMHRDILVPHILKLQMNQMVLLGKLASNDRVAHESDE